MTRGGDEGAGGMLTRTHLGTSLARPASSSSPAGDYIVTPDPDPYCDHDWQFDERPTNEAKPVKLRCSKCGAVKDYAQDKPDEPNPLIEALVELTKALDAMPIIPGLWKP